MDKSIKLYELEHLSKSKDRYTENKLDHIQTYKSLTMSSDWKNKSISKYDIESVLKLEKLPLLLDDYIEHKEKFMKVKIAITAISWGVAAYYSTAWWMFGGNIAFAGASTVQATTLTSLTIKSRKEINSLTEIANEIKAKIEKQNSKSLFKFIKDFLKSEASKSLENISEAFSDLLFNFITVINGESPLTAYNAIRQISTAFDDIEYYLPNFYSSKFDEVISKIMAAALVLSRAIAVCVATTWASPAAVKVITFASIIERFADNITSLAKLTLVNLV
ncbi:hypothetical protein [Mycoplasma putrefaciens]|uniref:hypothetical protein n=1 Tax=Mycoplasma putrefaciens TaxID=2123 RepID=UPI0005BA97CB|nr:hypothetical protein [Mycoplasma putrefaciens]